MENNTVAFYTIYVILSSAIISTKVTNYVFGGIVTRDEL